ncbi:MAG: hypothetical protein WAO24_10325 [Peptococcia bacterium]
MFRIILRKMLTQAFLFLFLLTIWWRVEYQDYITTAGKVSGPIPVFPKMQIEMLKSPDPKNVTAALEETARSLINYLEPELAKEFWDCRFLFVDLLPGEPQELVVSLSLAPDRGVLVLLQQQNNHYTLLYYLNNLLPLTKLEKFPLPSGSEVLVTREEHEERTGSFSESHLIKLWTWKDQTLQVVWNDNSFWEVNWLNTWQDPQSKSLKWYKLTQEAGISYQPQPQPTIIVQSQQSYAECPTEKIVLPPAENFQQLNQRRFNQSYLWNEEWQRFIIKTATIPAQDNRPAQKVAVLKDLELHLESLADNQPQYEVIGTDGKIFLIDKSQVRLDL